MLSLCMFLSIASSIIGGVTIHFPDQAVLQKQLDAQQFNDLEGLKVNLSQQLSNKQMTPISFMFAVEFAFYDYIQHMKENKFSAKQLAAQMALLEQKKGNLFAALLQDFPDALAEVERINKAISDEI